MPNNTNGSIQLIISDQVSESIHWAIYHGEIMLPPGEIYDISSCTGDLGLLMRVVFRLYIRSLSTANYRLSAQLLRIVPLLADPFLPGICAEAGIGPASDEYLDTLC